MDGIQVLVLMLACLPVFLCCDINNCSINSATFMPSSCSEVTKRLDCLKTEYAKCRSDDVRNKFRMMVPFIMSMHPPSYCGFDMDSMMKMFTSRTGLMMTMMNNTRGVPPIAFGGDVMAAGPKPGQTQQTEAPPPAPGLLPRFRGGASMQTSDTKSGIGVNRVSVTLALVALMTSLVFL